MLNEVHLQGIVVKNDEFRGTRLVRIAVHHDPGRGAGGDTAYVTLRIEPPLALAAANLRVGARVRACGYITHRDYPLSLVRFAETAVAEDGAEVLLDQLKQIARQAGSRIFKPHTMNEVVVERLQIEQESGG